MTGPRNEHSSGKAVPKVTIAPLAIRKMRMRGIPKTWVEDAIRDPDETVPGYGDRLVAQKYHTVGGKGMLLRVVYEGANKDYVVVTAYLTSQIERYRK